MQFMGFKDASLEQTSFDGDAMSKLKITDVKPEAE